MRDPQPPAGFDPLKTCPSEKRARYAARAARAHVGYRAAVELMCLSCVAWDRPEATRCQIKGCPLYALNRALFGVSGDAGAESEPAADAGDAALEVADA